MKEYSKLKKNRVKRGRNRATYDVDSIHEILDAGFLAHVSHIYESKAICLPMAYGRKDDKIYLHGSNANRMLLALIETKEVSMTVTYLDGLVLARSGLHHSVNYRSVTLFGTVKIIETNTNKKNALVCIMEQMIKGRWNEIRPIHQKELDRTLVLEITIETASAKIRDIGIEDEPEDYNLNIWAGIIPISQVASYPIPDQGIPQKMELPEHVYDYYIQNKANH